MNNLPAHIANDLELAEKFVNSTAKHYVFDFDTRESGEKMAIKSGAATCTISTLCSFPGVREWLIKEMEKMK
jgi:hypothetical protein